MKLDVVTLPKELEPRHLEGRSVVVFDVLRATTTMTAALSAGVKEILIFPSTAVAAATAARGLRTAVVLCGEEKCLMPAGFDLGNSPAGFTEHFAGRRVLMSTTNGTRAILAARSAPQVFVGAITNAAAVANALAAAGRDVTLLCAGTQGNFAIEDVLGAGAVLDALSERAQDWQLESDVALMARTVWRASRNAPIEIMRQGLGGRNVIDAGLEEDIAFAAQLDVMDVVGAVSAGSMNEPPVVRRL